jgi:hypothetical protein
LPATSPGRGLAPQGPATGRRRPGTHRFSGMTPIVVDLNELLNFAGRRGIGLLFAPWQESVYNGFCPQGCEGVVPSVPVAESQFKKRIPIKGERAMSLFRVKRWLVLGILVVAAVCAATLPASGWQDPASADEPLGANAPVPSATGEYVVLAWNDLGMHCYNRSFQDLAVLPPYNTLWAQVIRVGDPPEIVTTGIRVEFSFADNTYSVGKSNFWATSPYRPVQNAQWLFGLTAPLANNVGLTGTGLSGTMALHGGDHFEAVGIPLTEFRDSQPTVPYPYQIATVVVYDQATGLELARTRPVAPVSTEMHCDNCHYDRGPGNEDIATGVVEQNILTQHQEEDEVGPLMNRRPILCAECHASAALGAPGRPGVPSLSRAMHDKHDGKVPDTLQGCYNCHPGPQTQCLRDVMSSSQSKIYCVDCHGTMYQVSQNPSPWLNEPRCDDERCHGSGYAQDAALYRMSREHGDVYCAACHDSPHAIAPSTQANDAIKFIGWQGHAGALDTCIVCHASWPMADGPHGMSPPEVRTFTLEPDRFSAREPGVTEIYNHTLHNKGNLSDSYQVTWTSSQGWATVTTPPLPVFLAPGQTANINVTVTIPNSEAVRGLIERTVVTATSVSDGSLVEQVVDRTMVPRARFYLPIILR